MRRLIEKDLEIWANDPDKRVLLLRGARQVGKTYSIRAIGSKFEHFLEVNFEQTTQVRSFFDGDLDIKDICRKLSIFYNTPVIPGKTLLFLDEIQACPDAVRALRFFHEQDAGLHVVAAGSLIEFALRDISSFGVGRIQSLYMYPFSFLEFLWGLGEDALADELKSASPSNPLDPVFHRKLLDIMRTHMIIGGLPAVVACYVKTGDVLKCQLLLDDLLRTIRDDFAKYAARTPVIKLIEVFSSVALQAGGKFKITRAAQDTSLPSYKHALELLALAGVVYKIHHTSACGIPLAAQTDEKKYKAILFDSGLHQRVLGLDLATFTSQDDIHLINEGSIAEAYAGLEIIAGSPRRSEPRLYYWHRESRGSNAEVDYVMAHGQTILPVEVKAMVRGGMKSLHMFISERNLNRGVRLSQENFGAIDTIIVLPLYAAGFFVMNIDHYLQCKEEIIEEPRQGTEMKI